MNYYTANAIQVPTKLTDSTGGSVPRTGEGVGGSGAGGSYGNYAGNTSPSSLAMGLNGNHLAGGLPNQQELANGMNNIRRNSSSSSLDVAATIFSSMQELDADEAPLYSQTYKTYQTRDIVQFVPFLKYQRDPNMLAREVLREIPGQIVKYFQGCRIQPNMPN